jgi:hypothetical protein
MNPFSLLPLCTAVVLVFHVYLHLSARKESRYSFWLLLAGLPALAVAFFLSAVLTKDPDPSRRALGHVGDGGFVAMVLSLECLGLWIVVGFVELALRFIAPRRHNSHSD